MKTIIEMRPCNLGEHGSVEINFNRPQSTIEEWFDGDINFVWNNKVWASAKSNGCQLTYIPSSSNVLSWIRSGNKNKIVSLFKRGLHFLFKRLIWPNQAVHVLPYNLYYFSLKRHD